MPTKKKNNHYPVYFYLPALLIFSVFYVGPSLLGMIYSLTDWSSFDGTAHYNGIENYRDVFRNSTFFQAVGNQFKFAAMTAIGKTFLGLIVALLLNVKLPGRNFARSLVFLSCMFSPLIVGFIFNYILRNDGFFNMILRSIGLGKLAIDWLGSFDYALFSVAGVEIWMWVGFNAVIILAAIQTIPGDLLECASIDGATGWKKFLYIKLPFIRHAVNLALLINVIGGLKGFDIFIALTGGGPGHSTEVISTFLFKAISSGSLGYASAINFIQFVLISCIALIINWLSSKREVQL